MADLSALLQGEIGVLDFRQRSAYEARHIRHSLHISGLPGLLQRFSWLPPPKRDDNAGLALIVICSKEDEEELRKRLGRWNVVAVTIEGDEEFWKMAEKHGQVVYAGQQDVPALLFEPSAVVELAIKAFEAGKSPVCTVLDLGCGAARDIAWIIRQKSKVRWLATGLDNLHATLERAALLRDDMHLGDPESSHIESLVWAEATEQGTLQALQFGPTSKSKGVAIVSDGQDDSLESFAASSLPHKTYDLVLLVRFLPRPLLLNLPALSHKGTIIAISHFTTIKDEPDYPSPDSSKRFEAEDVTMLIEHWGLYQQWRLYDQVIHRAEDGRPLRSVLFQREE